jgi:hypothetical protein
MNQVLTTAHSDACLQVPDFAADLKEKTGRSMYKFLMPLGI